MQPSKDFKTDDTVIVFRKLTEEEIKECKNPLAANRTETHLREFNESALYTISIVSQPRAKSNSTNYRNISIRQIHNKPGQWIHCYYWPDDVFAKCSVTIED